MDEDSLFGDTEEDDNLLETTELTFPKYNTVLDGKFAFPGPTQTAMGIVIKYKDESKYVPTTKYTIGEEKHEFVCNEPENLYAMQLLAKMTETASIEKPKNDKSSFDPHVNSVLDNELIRLALLHPGFNDTGTLTDREFKAYGKIFKAFNTPIDERNKHLAQIACIYAKIRLGRPGYRSKKNEFEAMYRAVSLWILFETGACDHTLAPLTPMIGVSLMIGHLRQYYTALAFDIESKDITLDELAENRKETGQLVQSVTDNIKFMKEHRTAHLVLLRRIIMDYKTNEDQVYQLKPTLDEKMENAPQLPKSPTKKTKKRKAAAISKNKTPKKFANESERFHARFTGQLY